MSSITSSGVSALLAFQRSLETVSHNIANANTPGYSRQTLDLQTRTPNLLNGNYVGTGVEVGSARRVTDQILIDQVRVTRSAASEMESLHALAKELDSILGDETISLSGGFDNFNAALQGVSNSPDSVAARQAFIAASNNLINRFSSLEQQFNRITTTMNGQMDAVVEQVNSLTSSIAAINNELLSSQGSSAQPNDLLDKRDQLIADLGELVGIRVVEDSEGSQNVFLTSGAVLVLGATTGELTTVSSNNYPEFKDLAIVSQSGTAVPISKASGGKVAGILAFRDQMLLPTKEAMNRIAISFADQFNQKHELGMDLKGAIGADFFEDINTVNKTLKRSVANTGNTGNAEFAVTLSNSSELTGESYRLQYDNGTTTYTLSRVSDGTTVTTFQPADLPVGITGEGFSLALSAGAIQDGDSFLIKPTVGGAGDLKLLHQDPARIAAALPVKVAPTIANAGNSQVTITGMSNKTGNTPLATPVTLTYDAANQRFDSTVGGPFAYDPATDSGNSYTLSIPGLGDVNFDIKDIPSDGDVFTLSSNAGGVGDNRNAIGLIALSQNKTMDNGTSTFSEVFNKEVASTGAKTHQAEMNKETSESLEKQALARRDAMSGVNLDEEAANLLKFQQAYQAAAQIISISTNLFSSIIQLLGR